MVSEKDVLQTRTIPAYNRRRLGCPCPGISILINHGYINVTNQYSRISARELINALVEGFNLSWFHAAFLSILAVLLCGKWFSVSVAELGVHGPIEHDGSISRHDWASGDSLNPDEHLVDAFVDPTRDGQVSLADYAARRSDMVAFAHQPWSLKTRLTALGEVGLTIAIFGDRKELIHSRSLRTIFLDERLPQDWQKPKHQVSIIDILSIGWKLNRKIKVHSPPKGVRLGS